MTGHVSSGSKSLKPSKEYRLTSVKYVELFMEPKENMILTSVTSVKEKTLGAILEDSLIKGITRFTSAAMNVSLGMGRFIVGFRNLNAEGSLRLGESTEQIPLSQVRRIGWLCVL